MTRRRAWTRCFGWVFFSGLLTLRGGQVAAQPFLEPTRTPFAERFTERVPVSGRNLVGLLSVPSPQAPSGMGLFPGTMALQASLTASSPTICVRATTQDGRYSAENTFASRLPVTGGQAGFDWPTAYSDTLRTVLLSEVAAVARRGSCRDDAEILPVMLGTGRAPGSLQLLVNTRGAAITAALRDPETGRTLRRANCARVSGVARVAFDARCVLGTVDGLPGRLELRLEQVSRDGLQTEVLERLVLRLSD